jgi:hypothetical protein
VAQPLATNASNGLHRLVPSFPPLGLAFPVFATENEDNHPLSHREGQIAEWQVYADNKPVYECFQNGPNQAIQVTATRFTFTF